MQLPSLKFLRTFHIAARRGSFKAAAEELYITASAVSHQMKQLESHLGVDLFDRTHRTLILTGLGLLSNLLFVVQAGIVDGALFRVS